MALPPQVQLPNTPKVTFLSYDRLSTLYVDSLLEEGQHEKAFAVAEQLSARKVTSVLYDALGEEFFLKGLGEYEEELRTLLAEIRAQLAEGNREQIEELSAQLEELLFALYEEYPAALFLLALPSNADVLSLALSPEHPYLKVVSGKNGYHGFLHDGTIVPAIFPTCLEKWPAPDS